MRWLCVWCALVCVASCADDEYYAPQTYAQKPYRSELFRPADGSAQATVAPSWTSGDAAPYHHRGEDRRAERPEPWRLPYVSKEQQAAILHHKQSLSSEGAFRFEYASDNGLSAGEVIEPDGSRVGAYQYKDPSGHLVSLKYRAGKDGFQILEGSHLPKSPEPVPPPAPSNYNAAAYEEQRRQYELQQHYNQQPATWQSQETAGEGAGAGAGRQYNWRAGARDDGQYRENDVDEQSRGPHSFGDGYAFAFKG